MNTKDPKLTVIQFNECINNHDVDGIGRLMAGGHTFIDRDGTVHQPEDFVIRGWRRFLEMFPNYRNTFTRLASKDNLVVILGHAFWSDEQPYDAVIWTATIVNDLVEEWRIYADSETNRRALHLAVLS